MIGQRVGMMGVMAVLCLTMGLLAGCDYWPPALQAQIEQLRGEVQLAVADRTRLENQVKETVKSRDELQMRLDEMSRINHELTGRVATLEQNVLAEREKVAKLSKPLPRASAKAAKKTAKPQPKKKPGTVAANKGR
jgi:outer membrane murein-binding lipoprotein Lpp